MGGFAVENGLKQNMSSKINFILGSIINAIGKTYKINREARK